MTITRRSLFDEISALDQQIADLNECKSDCFSAYREQLQDEKNHRTEITAELAACKKAFRRLRALDKDADAVLEQDALVDEIVAELQQKETGTDYAPRASRTSPSPQPNPQPAAPSDASGEAAPPTSPGRTGAASTFPDDQLDIPACLRRDGATATAPPS